MEQLRMTEFRNEIETIRLKSSTNKRERLLQLLGIFLMICGVALSLVAYFVANSQQSGDLVIDSLEHNEHIILAITGVCIALTGCCIFLRYSFGRFLRFWLLRLIHENNKRTADQE
jgi:drug/metabolite transporter (DMT)-like permease